MLIQFTVRNFRSIRDSVVLSYKASKSKYGAAMLLNPLPRWALLPVVGLFGANAAGKSNVLLALLALRNMLVGNSSRLTKGQKLPYESFAGVAQPTSFEIMYIYDGVRYDYGIVFNADFIQEEYLYHWPNGREALIFKRQENVYEFRDNVTEQNILAKRTPANKPYLVSSNDWNLAQTEKAYQWFQQKILDGTNAAPVTMAMLEDSESKKQILREILLADLGISDVKFMGKEHRIVTVHRIKEESQATQYFQLPLECESSGTQCYLARIGAFLKAMQQGSLLVVDEIEKSMHPLLTRRLIELILDKEINTKGAQLLFTSHDALLMDLELLRRDQIWLAQKDPYSCATELYALSSFSPRRGENIRRRYLEGRFGAIPFVGEELGNEECL